jgi:uridine kinase
MRPLFVGIAGASGSGKSQLAKHVVDALHQPAVLLSLDCYYRVLDHLPLEQRGHMNFDHPDSLDWDLFLAHLSALAAGRAVDEPIYLFDQHTRAATSRRIEPAPFIIVEGILAFHQPDVRARLDLRVYVDTPDELCFARRLERDVAERGRTPESVHRQYEETVRPMAAQYVWPSKWWAHVVVPGTGGFAVSVAAVLKAVQERVGAPA